jgi:chromosome segregation ATPase
MVILLLVILGGGLIVLQQKQSPDKSNNGRTTLNENDQVRGKFQFDAAKHQNASLETEQRAAEKLAQRYKSNIAAAERKVATARKNESRNDDQLAKANIARLQLEQLLEESRQHNAKMNRQIKTLENQSQLGNMTNDDLAESREIRLRLEQRLAAVSRSNANLLQRVKQMEDNGEQDLQNNAGLTDQLRNASEELETARKIISGLQRKLKDGNTPASNTPKGRAHAVGDIKYVNTRQKFIGINGGSDNGVKTGDVFRIISRSTGESLGRITITKTGPSFAGGTLNNQGIGRLRMGDLLFR